MANPRVPLSLVDPAALTSLEPPRPLGQHGQALWDKVQEVYQIDDPGSVEMLTQAAEAADRVASLTQRINADGEVIYAKTGPRANPLLRDELQGRAFVVRTLERLGLNLEPVQAIGRPPGRRPSNAND